MKTFSNKKQLLASVSIVAMTALGAANAFAAAQSIGAATAACGADCSASGVVFTGQGTLTVADTVTVSTTAGVSINAGAAGQGTATFAGDSTVDGTIGTTGSRVLQLNFGGGTGKTVTINGDTFALGVAFTGDNTVILGDDDDITTTNGITTDTTNTGTLQMQGNNANQIGGNIGTSSKILKRVSTNSTGTLTTTGDIFATDLYFDADGTVTIADNKNLTAAVVVETDDTGILTFLGTSTHTGQIGVLNTELATLNVGAAGETVSIVGNVFATNIKVTGTGTLNLTGDATVIAGTGLDFDDEGFVVLEDGSDVTGTITASADNDGTVTANGASTISGNIGAAAGSALTKLIINGADKTLTTQGTVDAASIYFDADGTLSIADNQNVNTSTITTGNVTTETNNTGTVTFLGTSTFGAGGDDDLGVTTTGELKQINILAGSGTAAADTVTITGAGEIHATSVVLGDHVDDVAALAIGAGGTLNAAVTTFATGDGTITFAGAGTMQGQIGTSSAELLLVTVGNGAVTTDSNIYATSVNFAGDNTLTVAAGKSITSSAASGTAMVTTGTDDEGTLTFSGTTTVADDIGTSALQLKVVNFSDGTATVSEDVNADTINVLGDTVLELTGAAKTHDADIIAAGSAIVDINGNTVTIAGAGNNNTGAFTMTGNNTLRVTVTGGDNNDSGKLAAAGAVNLADGTVNVVVDSSEYIAAGTTYDIVTDGAGNITDKDGITITEDSYVLGFTSNAATASNTLTLTATRANTYNSSSTGKVQKAVGSALETIGTAGDANLDAIVGQLDTLTSASAVESALETLTPEVNGQTTVAVANASSEALGTVSTRLSSLRTGTSGVATGSAYRDIGLWGQVFGSAADQGDREGVRGYQADTFGGSIGVDTEVMDDIRLGVAGTYSDTDVDSARGGADISSFQGTVYGSYQQGKRWYDAMVGVAFNNIDTSRNVVVGNISNQAKGDSDGNTFTGKLTAGYDMKVQGPLQFTPRGSLQYTYIAQDDYTETGSTANLIVSPDENQALIAGLGFDLAYPLTHAGISYLPSLSFTYLYDFIGDEAETNSRFTSTSTTFLSEGADVAQSTFEFGVGLDIMARDDLTVSVDYDLTEREDYSSHAGSLKARLAF